MSDDIGSNIEGEMEAQSVILRDEMVEIATHGIMILSVNAMCSIPFAEKRYI